MIHCTVMLVFDNYVDESEISLLNAHTWLKRYKDTGVVVKYKLTPRTEITNYIKLKDLSCCLTKVTRSSCVSCELLRQSNSLKPTTSSTLWHMIR